jgi:DNA-binding CsgD family transcriptional regulator
MKALAQKQRIQDVEKVDTQAQAMIIAESLRFLADIASLHEDDTLAYTLYEESLVFAGELDYRQHIGSCLERLASMAAEQDRLAWASRLYRLTVSLRQSVAPSCSPARGCRSSDHVIASTTLLAGQTFEAKCSKPYPAGLTAREVEVLRLLAEGLTDAQIAGQLVISPRTVNNHLTSIYSKIQVSSRSAATRYAIKHKLV